MSLVYENMPKKDLGLKQIAKVENFVSSRSRNPIAN